MSTLARRDLLKLGGSALLAGSAPARATAQTPRRGGTVTIRAWDPPHFDYGARLLAAWLDR